MPARVWSRHPRWKKPGKYRAVPTWVGGRRFASKREAAVYGELLLRQQAGEIRSVVCQPRYELQPRPERIVYVADFLVTFADGRVEVWDVKGYPTEAWGLKAKLFRAKYPLLPLRVVR